MKKTLRHHSNKQKAFTLIELSIALVIIGLLVGGVLVGNDLIRAAQYRTIGSLIEQSNVAANTFRLKYNCLPGDCNNITQFMTNNVVNGNGNGNIIAADGGFISEPNWTESNQFFWQLIQAGLMDDKRYCTYSGITCNTSGAAWSENYGLRLPVGYTSHQNYPTKASAIVVSASIVGNMSPTPVQSYKFPFVNRYTFAIHADKSMATMERGVVTYLDRKYDDGLPLSRNILALTTSDADGIRDDSFDYYGSRQLTCMDRTTTPYSYAAESSNKITCVTLGGRLSFNT